MGFLTAYQSVIVLVFVHAIAGLSMWLVMSQNVISLAGAGFMAIGGYASAILFTSLGWPLWASAIAGTVLAAIVAYVVGRPIVKLQTHYLAIATLGFTLVVKVIAVNWRSLTNGPHGIYGLDQATQVLNAAAVFVCFALVMRLIARSHVGRSMYAVGDDPVVARAFGIPFASFRLWGFVASAVVASTAGSLLAHRIRVIEPAQFGEILAFMLLAYAILGGIRHWAGAPLGAAFFIIAPEVVRYFDRYREVMTGLVILLVMIYLPGGLIQPIRARRAWRRIVGRVASLTGTARMTEAEAGEPAGGAGQGEREETDRSGVRREVAPVRGPSAKGIDAGRRMNGERGDGFVELDIADVTVRFGGVDALRDVDLELRGRAGIVGIIGPNGSGKSTLLNVLGGQLEPDSGTVSLDGRDISGWPTERRAKAGVVRTFQSPRIESEATVLDGLLIGTSALRRSSVISQILHTPAARREEERFVKSGMDLLDRFNLAGKAALAGSELSFGQQRLVELARCAIASPRVVLLDEPTSGVNPEWFSHIDTMVRAIADEGALVVLVEHNMDFVEDLCNDVVVLDSGSVIARDSMVGLRASRRVMDAYLGARA